MKARKTFGFPNYVSLALILVIIALWTYIFNKLFDRVYGNFNSLDLDYLLGWILLFAVAFGASLWWIDRQRGTIAKMFGQGEDLYKIRVKRKGFELEVTGSSPQEVEALFNKLDRKSSAET
jgi:hypothetical protein